MTKRKCGEPIDVNNEHWKPTHIFPEHYRISDSGELYSVRADKILRYSVDPYGYIRDMRIVGKELSFQDLKFYIGKQVVKCASTESNQYFRVYKVIEYYEDCFTYYKRVRPLPDNPIGYGEYVNEYIHDVVGIKECMACYEPAFTCDRVGLSDNGVKENAVVCEAHCSNGRYEELLDYQGELESFYEIRSLT